MDFIETRCIFEIGTLSYAPDYMFTSNLKVDWNDRIGARNWYGCYISVDGTDLLFTNRRRGVLRITVTNITDRDCDMK